MQNVIDFTGEDMFNSFKLLEILEKSGWVEHGVKVCFKQKRKDDHWWFCKVQIGCFSSELMGLWGLMGDLQFNLGLIRFGLIYSLKL